MPKPSEEIILPSEDLLVKSKRVFFEGVTNKQVYDITHINESTKRAIIRAQATHDTCECGKVYRINFSTKCEECSLKQKQEKWRAINPGDHGPIFMEAYGDEYFGSLEEALERYNEIHELEWDHPTPMDDVITFFMLVNPEPESYAAIDLHEMNHDVTPEDQDLSFPAEIDDLVNKLNEKLAELPPPSYGPNYKTRVKLSTD